MTGDRVVLHRSGHDRSRCGASAIEALASVPAHCLARQRCCMQDGRRLVAGTLHPLFAGVASLMNSPFTRQGGFTRRAVAHRTGGRASADAGSGSRVASRHTAKHPSMSIIEE
jgi:hypothetical protein